jgi:hypothetical protein
MISEGEAQSLPFLLLNYCNILKYCKNFYFNLWTAIVA